MQLGVATSGPMRTVLLIALAAGGGALRLTIPAPTLRPCVNRAGWPLMSNAEPTNEDEPAPVVDATAASEARDPAPEGYVYDAFGRLVVKQKERTVKEEKPASPLVQRIGGVIGLLLTLYAAGFIMNYSMSPASPLINDNRGATINEQANAKYAPVVNRVQTDD